MPLLGNNIYAEQVEQPDNYSTSVFVGGGDDAAKPPAPEVWPGESSSNAAPQSPVEPVSGGSFMPFAGVSSGPSYDFSGLFSGNDTSGPSLLERVVMWVKQIFS